MVILIIHSHNQSWHYWVFRVHGCQLWPPPMERQASHALQSHNGQEGMSLLGLALPSFFWSCYTWSLASFETYCWNPMFSLTLLQDEGRQRKSKQSIVCIDLVIVELVHRLFHTCPQAVPCMRSWNSGTHCSISSCWVWLSGAGGREGRLCACSPFSSSFPFIWKKKHGGYRTEFVVKEIQNKMNCEYQMLPVS